MQTLKKKLNKTVTSQRSLFLGSNLERRLHYAALSLKGFTVPHNGRRFTLSIRDKCVKEYNKYFCFENCFVECGTCFEK